ncbi:serine hydrolase domain-containing protein [Erythrobacter sp.]|uniref:serine hydrolase domain-containing protein n=1 Tax=Sphingomonadales TaxID=204457 RepID=UPI0032661955
MRTAFTYTCIGLVCTFNAANLHAQPAQPWEEAVSRIERQVPAWLSANDVPSVSIALVYDNEIAWAGTFGEQAPGQPATNQTIYNIASLTKPITAEVFLRLAQEGDFQLDEPLSLFWTDPAVAQDSRHHWLTPRLALSHQTGFPNWRHEQPNQTFGIRWDPGTQFGYSGEGYSYAARAAENKLGQTFGMLAAERVFNELDLRDLSYIYRDDFGGRIAAPKGPQGEYGSAPRHSEWNAAGDALATSSAYARFMLAVMRNQGLTHQFASKRYVIDHPGEESVCDEAYQNCLVETQSGYALGWGILAYQDETIVMHRGGDWGVRSLAYFVPEREFGLVVLTNGSNGEVVIRNVVEEFHANDHWLDILHK